MTNAATQAELIRDEAIEQFNERMSNAAQVRNGLTL